MVAERKKPQLTYIQGAIDISGICTSPCPFLGAEQDRLTPKAYPHPSNRCYRNEPAIERQLQFQKSYCLSESYINCSFFQQEEVHDIPKQDPPLSGT